MLRGSPVWGVGFGEFGEVNRLAAHNSFVNCFSETGLVGYFLWLSLVGLTFAEAAALAKIDGEAAGVATIDGEAAAVARVDGEAAAVATIDGEDKAGADLARWGRAVHLSLVGFLAAAFFLSRTYSSVLFLVLGLGAALSDIARRRGLVADPTPLGRWIPRIVGLEIGSIIFVKIVTVVLL